MDQNALNFRFIQHGNLSKGILHILLENKFLITKFFKPISKSAMGSYVLVY
jgi:hypothetical protein